jgi:hypothetical protein
LLCRRPALPAPTPFEAATAAIMLQRRNRSNPAASGAVSDLFGDKPTVDPLSTTEGCLSAAITLFYAIEKRHGVTEAQRIFRSLGAPSAQKRRRLRERMLLQFLELLHRLYGFDNPQQAARYIAEHNAKLRLGPSSNTSEDNLRKYIGRLIDDYPDEAISKLLHESKNGKREKTSGVERPVSRKKARPKP